MPPRLPPLRPLRRPVPLRPLLRRPLSTAPPHQIPKSKPRRTSLLIPVLVGVGLAYYLFPRPSHAETQSSKTSSANENREATSAQSRKSAQEPGKAEKEANKSGGSSQDNKPGLAVDSKKPEKNADKDSKTGKVKDGHDESGQPKDEKLKGKAGQSTNQKTDQGKKSDGKDDENSGSEEGKGDENEDEEGAGPQAFDPETGEINWDCPCLGDLPHGVCGPQFRKAFECFVNSQSEEKGSDCVPAFAEMQDCFRAHPDVYKPMDVLDDDNDDLGPTSTQALETATKEGDKQLDQKDKEGAKEDKGKPKEVKKGENSKKPEKGKEDNLEHQAGQKPKQGDERKHENVAARSG